LISTSDHVLVLVLVRYHVNTRHDPYHYRPSRIIRLSPPSSRFGCLISDPGGRRRVDQRLVCPYHSTRPPRHLLWSIEDKKARRDRLVEVHEQMEATSEQGRGPGPALALRSSIDRSLPFISSSMRGVVEKPSTVEQSAFQLRVLGGLVLCRTAELVNHVISRANDTERPPWMELRGQYSRAASGG
jgi:hypothetical protein